ncbi:MAG: diguanylate cyclase [Clostridiales bacterium]|jgi:diguanylate cyclase (GGDEF)-like protein|nr:diguanylate cyclase [Clostridiales bacterium]
MARDALDKIAQYIDRLLSGSRPLLLKIDEFPTEYQSVAEQLNKLNHDLIEMAEFTHNLAKGNIWAGTPGRFNFLAAPLKELQSNLKHISWQAEQVAKGNFNQSLDFMGDYTRAFNEMIQKVAARENDLKLQLAIIDEEKRSLYRSKSLLSTVLHNISEIVIVLRNGETIFLNEAASQLENRFEAIESDDKGDNLISFIKGLSGTRMRGVNLDYYDKTLKRWYYVEYKDFIWSDEQYSDMFVASDITHHKRSEIRLKRDSEFDELTTIGNRKHGMRLLNEALAQKNSYPLTLCFIDLDRLKRINDEFGHSVGDGFLKNFALKFRRFLDRNKVITRLGGDEFLVMMRRTDEKAASDLIRNIEDDLKADRSDCFPYPCEFSYGLLQVEESNRLSGVDLINRTDTLMYKNKLTKRRAAVTS